MPVFGILHGEVVIGIMVSYVPLVYNFNNI